MNMKNIKGLLGVFVMLLGTIVFSACSEDEEQVTAVFPEAVSINCQPEVGEASLSFNVDQSWALVSSRIWCQFKDEGSVVRALNGGAGERTVTIVVTDDAWEFEGSMAEISMIMNGETKVIATVNRSGKDMVLEVWDNENHIYDLENPLPFTYEFKEQGGVISKNIIKVRANFDWQVAEKPSWITLTVGENEGAETGKANETKEVTVEFAGDDRRYPLGDGEEPAAIVFTDKLGHTYSYQVAVKYSGMTEDAVEFEENQYGWVFSQDAEWYWTGSTTGGVEVEKKEAPIQLKAYTPGEYKLIYLPYKEFNGMGIYLPTDDGWGLWMHTEDDGQGNITVGLDANISTGEPGAPTGDARKGCIMLLPQKVYEGLEGEYGYDLENLLDEDGAVIHEDYQKYVLIDFSQEGEVTGTGGFKLLGLDYMTSYDDELQKMGLDMGLTDEMLMDTYGTTNVYMWSFEGDHDGVVIMPNDYPLSEPFYTFMLQGEDTEWKNAFEPGLTTYPSAGLTLMFDNTQIPIGKEMTITFLDGEDKPFAVLVMAKW